MSWSYDPSRLATSTLMQVRLEIGDTSSTAQLLQDEEVEQCIATEATMWGAAARCCEIISRSFLRKADVRIGRGGTMLTYSTQAKQYSEMALRLRLKANVMNAPWVGGTSMSDKASLAAESDTVQPLFTKGMQANPRVGGQGSDSFTDDGARST